MEPNEQKTAIATLEIHNDEGRNVLEQIRSNPDFEIEKMTENSWNVYEFTFTRARGVSKPWWILEST